MPMMLMMKKITVLIFAFLFVFAPAAVLQTSAAEVSPSSVQQGSAYYSFDVSEVKAAYEKANRNPVLLCEIDVPTPNENKTYKFDLVSDGESVSVLNRETKAPPTLDGYNKKNEDRIESGAQSINVGFTEKKVFLHELDPLIEIKSDSRSYAEVRNVFSDSPATPSSESESTTLPQSDGPTGTTDIDQPDDPTGTTDIEQPDDPSVTPTNNNQPETPSGTNTDPDPGSKGDGGNEGKDDNGRKFWMALAIASLSLNLVQAGLFAFLRIARKSNDPDKPKKEKKRKKDERTDENQSEKKPYPANANASSTKEEETKRQTSTDENQLSSLDDLKDKYLGEASKDPLPVRPAPAPPRPKNYLEQLKDKMLDAYRTGEAPSFESDYLMINESATAVERHVVLKQVSDKRVSWIACADRETGKNYLFVNPVYYNQNRIRFSPKSNQLASQCVKVENEGIGTQITNCIPAEIRKDDSGAYHLVTPGRITWQ